MIDNTGEEDAMVGAAKNATSKTANGAQGAKTSTARSVEGARDGQAVTPSWRLSARALAADISAGRRRAIDALEEHIARAQASSPLNALCVERFEAARGEARAIDERRTRGETLPPLAGVPIAVKECLDVAGTPSTCGVPHLRDHRAERDDEVIARMKEAGCIIYGKTNVAQLLLAYESTNPLYGRTNNPWDHARTPGGSSGGSAALVAAGATPISLGTDVGGSCRIPAAYCGVVGFKPSAGRIDDPGRNSVSRGELAIPSQVGVIARDVDDAALALRVAHGSLEQAPHAPPLLEPASVDPRDVTALAFDDDGIFPACRAARRAVAEARHALEDAGCRVQSFSPPHIDELYGAFFALLGADGGKAFARVLAKDPIDPTIKPMLQSASAPPLLLTILKRVLRASGRPHTVRILDAFGDHSTDGHWRSIERVRDLRAAFVEQMRGASSTKHVVLLLPPTPLPAVRHDATIELGVLGAYACMMNVLGLPAGVVPVTTVRDGEEHDDDGPGRRDLRFVRDRVARESERGSAGLPVGVQVAAMPFRDEVALAVMKLVEERVERRRDGT